ncbi:MAG: RNA polymerase sigma factor [Dysgonamonadaceae bacterium]|jgi:RNA polymerase sigma factor (sigma-70 family)|nr:RNA polymerase sigma factor [Dysgonamonadaceae bacterium]
MALAETFSAKKISLKISFDVLAANKDNLESLITEYQPQLRSFIRKRVTSSEDAEDILQDVWERFVKTVNVAINPVDQVSAWLYRVAQNIIINHFVKKSESELPAYHDSDSNEFISKDIVEVLFDETSPSPEAEYLRSLVWQELNDALSELPVEQREVFELTELSGISMKELSEAKNIPVNTLLSRKHYAVLHLRKRLRLLYQEVILT